MGVPGAGIEPARAQGDLPQFFVPVPMLVQAAISRPSAKPATRPSRVSVGDNPASILPEEISPASYSVLRGVSGDEIEAAQFPRPITQDSVK